MIASIRLDIVLWRLRGTLGLPLLWVSCLLAYPLPVWAAPDGANRAEVAVEEASAQEPALNQLNELEFRPCRNAAAPAGAQCARLWVAEDPDKPAGRQIPLNIMRVRALAPESADPLFVIVGGPGGAAVSSAPRYLSFFRSLQSKRDIVFVDQRGTGESNGLPCTFAELQFGLALQSGQQIRQSVQDCLDELDAELNFYTTPYAVHDLEQVRQALGYRQVNMWGVSYGTRVILHYMRQYPDRLRTAVLDGVAPVAIQLPRFVAADSSRALDKIFTRCSGDPACLNAYGDLRSDWLTLLDELAQEPRELTLVHPRSREPMNLVADAATVSDWVRLALYARELAPILPQAIHRAVRGDFSVLGGVGLLAVEDIAEQVSQGMQMTVLCSEDYQFAQRANQQPKVSEQRTDASLLRVRQQATFTAVCEQLLEQRLAPGQIAANYFEPVQGQVPTLIFSGRYDPVTPPRWGEWVAEQLQSSLHITAEGAHHGVIMHGCTSQLVAEFVETGDLGGLDASCIEAIKPPAFFIDAAGPALTADVMAVTDEESL